MRVKCSMCDGSGKYWLAPSETCQNCKGSGTIEIESPSKEDNSWWLQTFGKSSKQYKLEDSGGSGKWLLFVNKTEIDDVWKKIRQETIDENLGVSSEVSTRKRWVDQGMPDNYMICVHTSNCEDKEDVGRVRNHLRKLGFTGQIDYKTD